MIRVGVVGVGHLGRLHALKYASAEGVELVGVCDVDVDRGRNVAAEVGTRFYRNLGNLIRRVDALSIAVPTVHHYRIAHRCLLEGKHVLIEKPITERIRQAERLIEIAEKNGLVLQVGHVERFNPALMRVKSLIKNPGFIEAERISPFPERSTDIDVVLDLMIHDLDLIMFFVKSPIKRVHSIGVPVLSSKVDIANARIVFSSGCVANITASRASLTVSRKIRIFQEDGYFSIDFVGRNVKIVRMVTDSKSGRKELSGEVLETEKGDPLMDEILDFVAAIKEKRNPLVTGQDGLMALKAAYLVLSKM